MIRSRTGVARRRLDHIETIHFFILLVTRRRAEKSRA